MDCVVKDIALYPSGEKKIEWVKRNMPLLNGIRSDFEQEKPFAGLTVGLSIHLEAKTAYLCRVLQAGGANMIVTGSNPLSTQDDVAAALVHGNGESAPMHVYALHGCTAAEYEQCIDRVLAHRPDILIDDGGDLVSGVMERFPELKDISRHADIGAPRVIYDPAAKKYLVYLPLPSLSSDGNHLSFPIYGAYANADFTDLETAPRLMFENPDETERHRRQDAVIVPFGGRYHMFFNSLALPDQETRLAVGAVAAEIPSRLICYSLAGGSLGDEKSARTNNAAARQRTKHFRKSALLSKRIRRIGIGDVERCAVELCNVAVCIRLYNL